MNALREGRLAEVFVQLADTLVADFDVVEFLHVVAGHCVDLIDLDGNVGAAGLMLVDQEGRLRVMASSDERARTLELFELEIDEGPCVECFVNGQPVDDADLRLANPRWPNFADRAVAAGFTSIQALPLRLRAEIIGVLNLFFSSPGRMTDEARRLAQAFADVATIGLLQERAIRHHLVLADQLQSALNSRVAIEQAKGLLAERLKMDMSAAFELMRQYARSRNQRLSDVAMDLVNNRLSTQDL